MNKSVALHCFITSRFPPRAKNEKIDNSRRQALSARLFHSSLAASNPILIMQQSTLENDADWQTAVEIGAICYPPLIPQSTKVAIEGNRGEMDWCQSLNKKNQ